MALLSLSSDATMSPSPPLSITAASGHLKPQVIRARRLRLGQASSEHLSAYSGVGCLTGTGTRAGDTDPKLQRVQQVTRTDVPLLPQAAHIPRPPTTNGDGAMGSWYGNEQILSYIYVCVFYII